MPRFQVSSSPPLQIAADQTLAQKIINFGATVYYKATSDVSSSSNDGNIASGSSLAITAPVWLATASGATTTVQLIDIDGMGFESVQPGAVLSNDAIEYLQNLTNEGGPGVIQGTSLTVTGGVTANTGTFSGLLVPNAGVDVQTALTGPVYKSRQVAANKVVGNKLLTADANYAVQLLGDGKIEWGAGGASAVDTNLYRNAADVLKTDDALVVTGALTSGALSATTGAFSGTITSTASSMALQNLSLATTGTGGLSLGVTGESTFRYFVQADGRIYWGPGSSGVDTGIFRSGVNELTLYNSGKLIAGTLQAVTFAGQTETLTGTGKTALTLSDTTTTTGLTIGADTNLYRSAADTLKTDDSLIVTGTLTSAAQTLTTATLSGTGKTAISLSDTTTTTGLTIGADTNLYRNAADTLKTDDALVVTGALTSAAHTLTTQTMSGTGKTALSLTDTTTTTGLTIGADTNLYRNAADTLKTDDALIVTGALTSGALTATTGTFSSDVAGVAGTFSGAVSGTTGTFSSYVQATGGVISAATNVGFVARSLSSSSQTGYNSKVTGDAVDRVTINAGGTYSIGDGTNPVDTVLYRSAANVLKTDDQFVATDGITTRVVAGAVSDGSFTATPATGTIAIDTTNSKIYVRVGSTWKSVTVA